MGLTKNSTRISFWLMELVAEAFFKHLEFGSVVFDVYGGSMIGEYLRM